MGHVNYIHIIFIFWSFDSLKSQNLDDFLTSIDHIQSYKIVYPIIESPEGPRVKRSSVEAKSLRISLDDWTLETSLNELLIISPSFVARRILPRGKFQGRRDAVDEDPLSCQVRRGFVMDQPESLVAITVCNGPWIYGIVNVTGGTFFLQPLSDGRHIIYESRKTLNMDSAKTHPFNSTENIEPLNNGLEHLPRDDYLRPKNFNTSSANDIFLAASRLSEAVWSGPDSRHGRDEKFYINSNTELPQPRNSSSSYPSGVKERVKRNLMVCNTQEFHNLTGDVIDLEPRLRAAQERDDENFQLPVEKDSEYVEYFYDRAWERNKLPKRKPITGEPRSRWLEIGIAADYSVVEFHGSRVQQYILAVFNIVSAIYRDPSLESNMKLVIVRMVLYADKKDGMVRRGNARRSLENVNRWNRKFLLSSKKSHDVAVWLTRLDLGGPSGYAPVSGVCDPARSCALNRDEGLTSAFIIAHELAHVLGLTHDGDQAVGNSCGDEASIGSVMAPMVAATFHRFHWSTCSKKEFHHRVKQWECLLNQPDDHNATLLRATIQTTFTMDEQCRMEFGDGYSLCRSFDLPEPCSHLWCGYGNTSQICKTKKGPPLEGTECGEDKWCINGYCELVDRRRFGLGPVIHNVRDGGWSGWGPWGKCSRSCGVGVQFRSRKCSDPTPAYGGADCEGDSEEFKICEIIQCSERIDLRAQQCARLGILMGFPVRSLMYNSTWLPYEPEEDHLKCQLVCRSRQTGEIYFSGENLVDGTPCTYGSSDICVQGNCSKMGCDNVMNSTALIDNCGECGGRNENCINVTSGYQRKLRRGMTRLAVIPRSAYNVRVELTLPRLAVGQLIDVVITIRDRRRRRNDIGTFDTSGRADVLVVEGAAFHPQKLGDTYTIWSRGPVFTEIVISLGVPDDLLRLGLSLFISSQYFVNRHEQNATVGYSWLPGGWGPCSASCGGGTRHKTIACRDDVTGKIVPRRKCSLTVKPSLESERCNLLSCEFKWISGEWEECTATCGLTGIQHRQLYCVHVSVDVTKVSNDTAAIIYRDMLPPDRCGPPPQAERECNRVPCQGRWLFSADWSPCSQSCGRGIQTRLARCGPDEPTDSLFDCGIVAPYEFRPCKTLDKRNPICLESCKSDSSEHCSLSVLRRYCEVPDFKRRCCLSCQQT
ncbi:A disintegrin and metalloproteinase with thrombospondin motifs 3-like [Neodiprion lecontei]|uniref:A disintegrin and metalloproteinase with thrombospondin motifs 3-like n=1 Tax=Neodiprion lecontei TaxID=441921 RepID=A0ABM3GEH4_NEOLC|nr:A disintegrin and metalloproteinase with thrombospondin motifs 3-like [Neodiprion lecontei]